MTENPWYVWTESDEFQQGDLIYTCAYEYVNALGDVDRKEYDVVIVSQSCDLAQGKLKMVQVCPFWELDVLAQKLDFFRNKRSREELRRGNLPGYHLLNRCPLLEPVTDFLVIDFRMQFAIAQEQLSAVASKQKPRLRLFSPYREHLAQALARFYMRVGLPEDIPPF